MLFVRLLIRDITNKPCKLGSLSCITNTNTFYIQTYQCCGACGNECVTLCPRCKLPTWEINAATLPGMSPTDHVTQWVLLVDCSHAVPVSVNLSVYQCISLCFVDLQHTSKSKHRSVVNPFTKPAVLQGINSPMGYFIDQPYYNSLFMFFHSRNDVNSPNYQFIIN